MTRKCKTGYVHHHRVAYAGCCTHAVCHMSCWYAETCMSLSLFMLCHSRTLIQADLEVMAKMLGGAREVLPIVVDENGRR